MNLIKDYKFNDLSQKTFSQLNNAFNNCNKAELSDYIYIVFFDAFKRGEIKQDDIFRLSFKALNVKFRDSTIKKAV